MMGQCEACGKDCSTGESCAFPKLQIGNTIFERLRYVGDVPCSGCGVLDGGVHHFNCPRELCPRCEAKLTECNCLADWD